MRYKKATKLHAPEYVDALMNWAQGLLDNEEIFPSEMGACVPYGRTVLLNREIGSGGGAAERPNGTMGWVVGSG